MDLLAYIVVKSYKEYDKYFGSEAINRELRGHNIRVSVSKDDSSPTY